ncbi:MAG: HAD family phosphatase [Candidatus Hatepunaea meridiana]|nr:HAD family phosphatase [Candidatus Hatepunaea meridiana]
MSESTKWGALFDLDGVLIDSPDIHARAWADIFRPYGIELPPERLHREEGRISIDIARGINEEFGLNLNDDVLIEMIECKREIYRKGAPRKMRTDALNAVKSLKETGWTLCLVSGSVRENLESALSQQELDYFDVILTAGCYAHGKPHPDPFLTACRKADLKPSNCVAIENAPLGISSARAAGMKVIALTSTLPEIELKDADIIVNDLTKLPDLLKLFKSNYTNK